MINLIYLYYFQTDRIRKAAAIKIQSFHRGHDARQKHKRGQRINFDIIRNAYKKPTPTTINNALEVKRKLATQILTFFEVDQDGDRITWFCQILVQERSDFLWALQNAQNTDQLKARNHTENWPYKIARLIKLALLFMATAPSQVITCL